MNFLVKQVFLLLFCSFIVGCASAPTKVASTLPRPISVVETPEEKLSAQLHEIEPEEMKQYSVKKGVIFAKTDFEGVLKTNYVQLLFVDQSDSEKKYRLHIGGSIAEQNEKLSFIPVEPGYFYVELPAGKYQIPSISIPVGTTKATEEINITFEVFPGQITYLGTLHIVGTKEKIRLGGVPLIRPGFEYTYEILDERQDAVKSFQENYPNVTDQIIVNLMK